MAIRYPAQLTFKNDPGKILSETQLGERYNWIVAFAQLNQGLAPTVREMSEGWGISLTAAQGAVDRLEEMGWISFVYNDSGSRRAGSMRLERTMVVDDLSHLETPKISVVISTYNRPVSLTRVLDCLSKQVHTNFNQIEVIIANDGSDKGYPKIAGYPFDFTYKYFDRHPKNKPQLYSLKNKAIEVAGGPVIWLLDDDLVFDEHTLLILRLYHMFLAQSKPLIIPHYANNADPVHYQAPFPFIAQPIDWDKVRVWPSFAGMSFRKEDWKVVGGIDEQYDGAMGFADLDFGMMMWEQGCQVILADGITCFIDDAESGGSHRNRMLYDHANARKFVRKWPDEWQKYDPGLADVA